MVGAGARARAALARVPCRGAIGIAIGYILKVRLIIPLQPSTQRFSFLLLVLPQCTISVVGSRPFRPFALAPLAGVFSYTVYRMYSSLLSL